MALLVGKLRESHPSLRSRLCKGDRVNFLTLSGEGRTFGSIKKDVKRKSSPARWKPRKVSASSPSAAVQVLTAGERTRANT
jgi:hypothetical protein